MLNKKEKFQKLDKEMGIRFKDEFNKISKEVSLILVPSKEVFNGIVIEPLMGPGEFRNTFTNLSKVIEMSSRILGRIRLLEVEFVKVIGSLRAVIHTEFPQNELRNDDMRKAKMKKFCPKTIKMMEVLEIYKEGLQAQITNFKLIFDITSRRLASFELEKELLK